MERTSTGTSFPCARSCFTSSSPLDPFNEMSTTAIEGRMRFNNSRPSETLSASPTTFISPAWLIRLPSCSRNMRWSSMIATVICLGRDVFMTTHADRTRNRGAALFLPLHHELASAQLRPVAHDRQAHSILLRVFKETDPVVGDTKGQATDPFFEENGNVL